MGLIAADDMTAREQAILYEWARSTTDSAFHAGYITRAWQPNDATLFRMRGYFEAGLSPDEAAAGLFETHH